jgi:hypothetical protein
VRHGDAESAVELLRRHREHAVAAVAEVLGSAAG